MLVHMIDQALLTGYVRPAISDFRLCGIRGATGFGRNKVITAYPDAADRRNIRMIERREHLRFAREAGQTVGIVREGIGKNLNRNIQDSAWYPLPDRRRPCPLRPNWKRFGSER